MNYKNDERLTSPNLSYTSREYSSIYSELLASIPNLTKEWSANDENDPGVVLLKLISMLGDMLSYNQDKASLEVFPRTVLQRANAQQIFRLVGYKMHWWRSAQVDCTIVNNNSFVVTIAKYNTFGTSAGSTVYTNLNQIEIPTGDSGITTTLIQGLPVTPSLISSVKPLESNTEWHDCYDYNIDASSVLNNRIYLKYSNIDETSISLVDNDETPFVEREWKLVDNINTVENLDKVFEFDVDEDNTPFIQLPDYWNTKYVITKFKLFLVLSNGKNGEIEENTLTSINPNKIYTTENISNQNITNQLVIFNTPSTYGYNPQTCTEGRIDAEKYINTIDTLVILRDFEKAIMRIDSVANVLATDIQIDPHPEEMTNYQINLYIVRKNDYNNAGSSYIYATDYDENVDEIFKESIVGELSSYKLMPYNLNVKLENYIDWIDWGVTGQIFLRKPINIDENYDLMVRINNNLQNRFNVEDMEFNEPINYMDVIECIMKTDKNIWHVDLDTAAIQYRRPKRDKHGDPTGITIKNKYMIYDGEGKYTGYYMTSLGCTDVEINKLTNYDQYNDVEVQYPINYEDYKDTFGEPSYLPGNDSNDITKTQYVHTEGTITPGGDGTGKNMGNKIVREDGVEVVIGLDFGRGTDSPREYEIYSRRIYDWTGYEPIDTNRIIDTSTYPYTIKIDNLDGTYTDTPYTLEFDSRMYLPDGSDSNQYLKDGLKQIPQLCNNLQSDEILTNEQIKALTDDEKQDLLNRNKIRDVWDIIDRQYETWTGQSIDKLTGEIYIKRGDNWYFNRRVYDASTGDILDDNGDILYGENMTIQYEPACREDVSKEYIQFYEVQENQTEFNFYLGQNANGEPELDSAGNVIQAFPIKPYSLYIYINGDREILNDTGTGRIGGTAGLLDGQGSIDYSTGLVTFKLNTIPTQSLKIIYKVNQLTYATFTSLDTTKFFVVPRYIKGEFMK